MADWDEPDNSHCRGCEKWSNNYSELVEYAEKITTLARSVIESAVLADSVNWYEVMRSRLDALEDALRG